MSVRAYRVIEIKTEREATFNLWHDEDIFNELQGAGYMESLGDECGGIMWIDIDELKKLIKIAKNPDTKKALEADLKIVIEKEADGIDYYCF